MAAIILPDHWRRQPTGPVELRDDGLASGIVAIIAPVPGDPYRILGSGGLPLIRLGSGDIALRGDGASMAGVSLPVVLGDEISLFAAGRITRAAGIGVNVAVCSSAGDQFFGAQFSTIVGSSGRVLHRQSNGGTAAVLNYTAPQTVSFFDYATFGGTSLDTGSSLSLQTYWQGQYDSTVNTPVTGTNASYNRFSLGGAWRSSSSYAAAGNDMAIGIAFSRILSAAEYAALHENPWQVYKRSRQVLYFDTGGGAAALVIPGDTHGHAADALVLSADLALAVGGDAHGHSADAPALSAELALSIAASAHAHMADGPVLSSAQVLAVADALHAHAAAALALTSDSALAVGGDAHAHTVDGVTLSATGADDLIIAGDMHGHAADAVAFTSASMLAVAGALHAHHAETAELGAALALSISGGLHAHSAESLTLTDVPTLGVAGALHAHTADSLALSTDVVLAIADAVHAHLADDVDMTYAATLAILESMHAHAADSLALTSGGGSALGLPDEIRVAIRERFILTVAAERRILRS